MKPKNLPLKVERTETTAFSKTDWIVFTLVVGLFVAARLWHLAASNFQHDELFSLEAAGRNWSGLIAFVVEDIVHPPLSYLLLKLWTAFGWGSVLWIKLLPVLISLATIFPFFLLCRELRLRAAEINLALALMAVNGYLIFHAQDVRMYGLLLLVSLCSQWLFAKFLNAAFVVKKHVWAMFTVNLLLVYTHYYGWLVVGAELTILLFWERRKILPFLKSIGGLILCFSPWAYAVSQAAIRKKGLSLNLDWIERPAWYNLTDYYATLNGRFNPRWSIYLGLLLFCSPMFLWAWHILKGKQEQDNKRAATFWWLLLLSSLPVVFSYWGSQVLPQSVWHTRSFIIVAVPYMILVAMAVRRLHPNWVKTAALLLIVGWSTLAGFKELNDDSYVWSPLNLHRMTWESLVHRIIEAERTQSNFIRIYTFEWKAALPIQFYLNAAHEKRFQVAVIDSRRTSQGEAVRVPLWDGNSVHYVTPVSKEVAALEGDHFWVVVRQSDQKQGLKIWPDGKYQMGDGFKIGPRGYSFILSPVWQRATAQSLTQSGIQKSNNMQRGNRGR